MLIALTACNGSDGQLILGDPPPATQQVETPPAPNAEFQNDSGQPSATAAGVDFVHPVYAASGGWSCTASTGNSVLEDSFALQIDGSGFFQRFGAVFWNRDLINRSITVHANAAFSQHGGFVISDIVADTAALQFTLQMIGDAALTETYECNRRSI